MSWLFSQVLVEECSAANCLDGEPSAQLNVMPTQRQFWRNDKMMEPSRLSQFGLTLKLLTEDRGEELLTSYLAASRAKTLAQQEKEQGSRGSDQDYGKKCGGWFAKYDQDTCLWKTPQCSLLEDLELYSETWPKQGMTVNGCAYPLKIAVPIIGESESGFWATPTTMDALPPKSAAALEREATVARPGRTKPANLRDQVSNMQNWPTPTANMRKESNSQSQAKRNQPSLSFLVGGKLNPVWVEWLMGWPLGVTDLKPLAMDKFQLWPQQHGESSLKTDYYTAAVERFENETKQVALI